MVHIQQHEQMIMHTWTMCHVSKEILNFYQAGTLIYRNFNGGFCAQLIADLYMYFTCHITSAKTNQNNI